MRKLITITEYGCPCGRIDTEMAELLERTTEHGHYHWSTTCKGGNIDTAIRNAISDPTFQFKFTGKESFDTHAGSYSYQILVEWGEHYAHDYKGHAVMTRLNYMDNPPQEGVGSPVEGVRSGDGCQEYEVTVEAFIRERVFVMADSEEEAENKALDHFHEDQPLSGDYEVNVSAECI